MRETMAEVRDEMPFEERRRKLLAEGALLRIGIMDARNTVRTNLNAESLAKSAMRRVFGSVSSSLGSIFSGKGGVPLSSLASLASLQSLQSLSPYLMSGISLLSKRSLRKPLLYGGIISLGAGLAYYLTRKRADDVAPGDEDDADIETEGE